MFTPEMMRQLLSDRVMPWQERVIDRVLSGDRIVLNHGRRIGKVDLVDVVTKHLASSSWVGVTVVGS